jgi:hypothetical protein
MYRPLELKYVREAGPEGEEYYCNEMMSVGIYVWLELQSVIEVGTHRTSKM